LPHPSITAHLLECQIPIDGIEYARRFKEKIRQRYESPDEAYESFKGKTGQISRTDFKRVLKHLDLDRGAAITDQCRKDLRKLIDRNGDKEITFEEFELFLNCRCKKIARCKCRLPSEIREAKARAKAARQAARMAAKGILPPPGSAGSGRSPKESQIHAPACRQCPNGHALACNPAEDLDCDDCDIAIADGEPSYTCAECGFDLCAPCFAKGPEGAAAAAAAAEEATKKKDSTSSASASASASEQQAQGEEQKKEKEKQKQGEKHTNPIVTQLLSMGFEEKQAVKAAAGGSTVEDALAKLGMNVYESGSED
jgi:hypothetical protein